jgi:hypothetical protein
MIIFIALPEIDRSSDWTIVMIHISIEMDAWVEKANFGPLEITSCKDNSADLLQRALNRGSLR